MKLCYFTYFTYPEVQGGAPLYTYKLAKHFIEDCSSVVVIGRKQNGLSDEINLHNICIKRIHYLKFNLTKYYRIIDKNFFYPLSASRKVFKECKTVDILHVVSSSLFFPIGYWIRKRNRIPIIVSIIEDLWTNPSNSLFVELLLKYQRWQLKMALKYADAIIVHSDYAQQKIKNAYPQYVKKVTKIYESIDPIILEQLEKEKNDLEHYKEEKENIIFVAGSLVKGKNIEVVLKAIKILRDRSFKLKLLIVGNGPLRDDLGNFTRNLGIEKFVTFISEVKHEEITKFFYLADIIIQASKGEGSQPPPSVIEYLASGKPVIISEACDMIGMLKHCTLRFNPNDENMLSQEIEKLLRDKDLCIKLGEKSKEIINKHFSNYQFFGQMDKIYYSVKLTFQR